MWRSSKHTPSKSRTQSRVRVALQRWKAQETALPGRKPFPARLLPGRSGSSSSCRRNATSCCTTRRVHELSRSACRAASRSTPTYPVQQPSSHAAPPPDEPSPADRTGNAEYSKLRVLGDTALLRRVGSCRPDGCEGRSTYVVGRPSACSGNRTPDARPLRSTSGGSTAETCGTTTCGDGCLSTRAELGPIRWSPPGAAAPVSRTSSCSSAASGTSRPSASPATRQRFDGTSRPDQAASTPRCAASSGRPPRARISPGRSARSPAAAAARGRSGRLPHGRCPPRRDLRPTPAPSRCSPPASGRRT